MTKSLHETARIVAVGAALAAGIGSTATAEAAPHKAPRVTIQNLAKKIVAGAVDEKNMGRSAADFQYEKQFKDGKTAAIKLTSSKVIDGKPSTKLNDVNEIDVGIYKKQDKSKLYASPVDSITFMRTPDGWNAVRMQDVKADVDTTHNTQIVAGQYLTSYNQEVTDHITNGPEVRTESPKAIAVEFQHLEARADVLIDRINAIDSL